MPPRKKRIVVVLDTNVVVGFYLSRNQTSPNAQVFRLWRDRRRLQLILSSDLSAEYYEALSRLGIGAKKVARLAERLRTRETVTHINLGARATESRDPDDNVVLSTAALERRVSSSRTIETSWISLRRGERNSSLKSSPLESCSPS